MTFVLVSVVLEVAANKDEATRTQAPLAIGFAVFCAHAVLLPVDGCSINPARSFGPAVVAGMWKQFYVFMAGPIAGGLLAVPFHWFFSSGWDTSPSTDSLSMSAQDAKQIDATNKGSGGGEGSVEAAQGDGVDTVHVKRKSSVFAAVFSSTRNALHISTPS